MYHVNHLLPAPVGARQYLSMNPADKAWTCQRCGEIAPLPLAQGFYARRLCSCERARIERQHIDAVRQTLRQAQAEQTYSWLGREWMEEGVQGKTFATFQRDRQPAAFDQAQHFCQEPQGVLALYGSYGTGKTHLLVAVANHLRLHETPCLFVSAVTLFEAISDRLRHDQDYHALLKRAIATPVLLLDDVDKPKPSEFREANFYQLINQRINAGRPLVISSNCMPHALERFIGAAARSRLMTGLVPVPMNGSDYRLELREKGHSHNEQERDRKEDALTRKNIIH